MGLAMAAPKEPRQTFTDRCLNEVPSEKSLLVAPFGFWFRLTRVAFYILRFE